MDGTAASGVNAGGLTTTGAGASVPASGGGATLWRSDILNQSKYQPASRTSSRPDTRTMAGFIRFRSRPPFGMSPVAFVTGDRRTAWVGSPTCR